MGQWVTDEVSGFVLGQWVTDGSMGQWVTDGYQLNSLTHLRALLVLHDRDISTPLHVRCIILTVL
jgi:hypothetical protein